MKPFQERVMLERNEVADRFRKLLAFIGTQPFSELSLEEQRRLRRQVMYMELYYKVLLERIEAFT
jgi:hypothetical protein